MAEVLVIGDSLAAQRLEDNLAESERWPQLFAQYTGVSINNLSKGFSTTQRLTEKDSIEAAKKASTIIIQLGIVDCAPRRFRRWEIQLIYKLPKKWQKETIAFFKNRRTQSPAKCYVSPSQFRKNIIEFVSNLKAPVYYIQILPASSKFKASNPKIDEAITEYNSILVELSSQFPHLHLIKFSKNEVEQITLDDGYHLNRNGHEEVSKRLYQIQF